MSVETSITLLTSLVSIGVAILLAGIPWAYTIHGRLTTIEACLSHHLRQAERVDGLHDRVARLEIEYERSEE
jgi:hypothetical protein